MRLSRNFSLEELTKTSTRLLNEPSRRECEKLLFLSLYLLQPIRERWGALNITSGFRAEAINASVGGSKTSQHLFGEAADIAPSDADIDEVYGWIVRSGLVFGQAIRESKAGSDWIHISLPRLDKINQETLVYDGKGYRPYV